MNINDLEISKVKKCADYIRYLSLESIERASSGHPGLPLGCAELGVLLYRYILRFNPEKPEWINRDRFILSAGHGSMLLYSLLYLAGYGITLEDIGEFRQLGSRTPGHPEYDIRYGIETTTGPLGQGFANAVGCAIEGKMLAQRFNQGAFDLFDYTIYTLMGDGCMMEGISSEAGSLAGHLGLDNLIAIYDSNRISIDGSTDLTFTEDTGARFEALGWHVEKANIKEIQALYTQLVNLKTVKGKPKLLVLKTTIGEGLDEKKDSHKIHGAPAGIKEIVYFIRNSKIKEIFQKEYQEKYGKDAVSNTGKLTEIMKNRLENKDPLLPEPDSEAFMKEGSKERKEDYNEWRKKFESYQQQHKDQYEQLSSYLHFELPDSLRDELLKYNYFKGDEKEEEKKPATRGISGKVLNRCAVKIPQIVGGAADLTGSTKAKVEGTDCIKRDNFAGRKIFFGVREHAMGAIGNGLALNKIMIPFTGTFFTFFDYMKPAVRMAALMKLKHLFIFSHDSIYVGEDGPTHQPIEHLNALRLIPGIYTFRPANDMETAFTYLYFLQKMKGPAAIVTTRQELPEEVFALPENRETDREELYKQFQNGAYIFYETKGAQKPDIIFAASGSEVFLALQTAELVEKEGKKTVRVRVISIPCMELFSEADISYKNQLFHDDQTPLVVIETASHRGINLFYDGRIILVDIKDFGKSAPAQEVGEYFGFTPEAIYNRIAKNIKLPPLKKE
ncbi:MAG: transketolase [Candidatus Aminicenantes bacterium]|nr:MAG: transketolase [Candidatus Aminicenantes bacterium]